MHIDFVRLPRDGLTPIFKVWNRKSCLFDEHNEHSSWDSWAGFVADLEAALSEQGIEFGGKYQEEGDDILRRYTAAAPSDIRNLGNTAPTPPARSRKSEFVGGLIALVVLFSAAALLAYAAWSQAVRPILGSWGWIEYKTTKQERYERFLMDAASCRETKKVVSEKNLHVPAIHIFVCTGGEEKVWVYGLEKATKSANGKWILE